MRFHNTPELGLDIGPPHGRHQALPGHTAEHYELTCSLKNEYGFPLPGTGVVTAEILVQRRSLGWMIDGALVSGFGPSYQFDQPRWSCEHADGTPADNIARRLFVVGLPFADPHPSPDLPGYELAIEHWSPDSSRCGTTAPSAAVSGGAWMCLRDAHYASCDQTECPDACGDGLCDAWETCSTCQSDCGVCGPRIADLAVASIDCPQSIDAGSPVSCDIVLVNHGAGVAGQFDNQLWLSRDATFSNADTLLATCRAGPLEGGSTASLTCSGEIPSATEADTWYLGVVTDSAGVVAELDESNNLDYVATTVVSDYVPPADLVVSSMNCLQPGVVTGREVECLTTLANIGGQAAEPFLVDLRLSSDTIIADPDTLLTRCQVGGVEAGSSRTILCAGTIPVGTLPGSWYVGVMADGTNTVFESDESNNTGHDSVFVNYGPADLVVSQVDCPPTATSPGVVSCSVRIANQGDSNASFFRNELRLSSDTNINKSDTLLGTCDVFSLYKGTSQTITCSGTIPAGQSGSRYVGIIVDSSSQVSELDESNNTGYDSVIMQSAAADLVVSSVNCPPSARSPGTVSCSVQITNQGGTAANSFSNQMRLSSDTVINTFDTLLGSCQAYSLPAGGTSTITCSGTIPAGQTGSRYVGIIADSSSQVSESNENNNTGYDTILLY